MPFKMWQCRSTIFSRIRHPRNALTICDIPSKNISAAKIRLIFTDVNMPGSMDGLKLAHYVRGRWPPVKIIVTSGKATLRGEELPAGAVFLGKPYHPEHVKHKVRELMAA